jgi:hypothetical protein
MYESSNGRQLAGRLCYCLDPKVVPGDDVSHTISGPGSSSPIVDSCVGGIGACILGGAHTGGRVGVGPAGRQGQGRTECDCQAGEEKCDHNGTQQMRQTTPLLCCSTTASCNGS